MSQYVRSRLTGWRRRLALVLFVFPTSWLAMWLVEPPDNQITDPANYWWYFVVTSATVGYGDFFPVSVAGHVVGVYVIVGGIVTLALLFTPWVVVVRQGDELRVSPPWDHVVDEGTVLYYLAGERINSSRLAAVE